MALAILGILVFAALDALVYPWVDLTNTKKFYRFAIQMPLQWVVIPGAIYLIELNRCEAFAGIAGAVAFEMLWFFWTADFLYYLVCELELLTGISKVYPGSGSFENDSHVGFPWARWTPLGFYRMFRYRTTQPYFTKRELTLQTLIGVVLTTIIMAVAS